MVPASRFPLLLICPSWFSQEVGYTALHIAARDGNLAIAKLLLQRGADPSLKTQYGEKVIDYARVNGHSEIVALLRAANAMSDSMGKKVYDATSAGDEAKLRRRIEDGGNVNWHNPNPGVRRRSASRGRPRRRRLYASAAVRTSQLHGARGAAG